MSSILAPIVTLLLMTSLAFAADDLQTAKVLAVKAHESGRIAYWEGRVAIYDGYPFYDITLLLGPKKYVVRYESLTGFYPSSWKVGREIQIRMRGKGKIYLMNGAEEARTRLRAAHQPVSRADGAPASALRLMGSHPRELPPHVRHSTQSSLPLFHACWGQGRS